MVFIMLGRITGEIIRVDNDRVIVICGGLGYEVYLPLNIEVSRVGEGRQCDLFLFNNQNEYKDVLYGFVSLEQKIIFEKLIVIKGIGIKAIFNVVHSLSITSLSDLNEISLNDLVKIKGVGKTTAQKIEFAIDTLLKKEGRKSNVDSTKKEVELKKDGEIEGNTQSKFSNEIEAVCELGIDRKKVELFIDSNYKKLLDLDSGEVVKMLISKLA